MRESERYSAQHRAAVLGRERYRQALERVLGWQPSAWYQHLRVHWRRWWSLLPFSADLWKGVLWRDPYAVWTQEEARARGSVQAYAARIAAFPVRPTISLLVAVRDPYLPWLMESIGSVQSQLYPHWELWLCLAPCSPEAGALVEQYRGQDARINVVTDALGLVTALNQALNLTGGEFIGLLGQHDTLAPHALYEAAKCLQEPGIDMLYSDEDAIDARGRRFAPFFKPDWSPDLCLSSLYACHLGIYRREKVAAVGGFRPAYTESFHYDLLLRCVERSEGIRHIPRVLYHKRRSRSRRREVQHGQLAEGGRGVGILPDQLQSSAKRALADALKRRGEAAEVENGPGPCTFQVRRRLQQTPLVSIIIPTRDRLRLLRRCIRSIETRSTYRQYEIVIVDNGSQEPHTLAYLQSLPHQVIRDDEPFNFARLNNRAVAFARGDCLLFLNNDIEVISPNWLEALLEHSQRREVGAVGCRLLYADGAIQHAGVVLGVRGVAGHAHKYLSVKDTGYFYFPHLIRNYSAVTAACLMTRKTVYEEVGGMEERLAVTFNDVDLCLRLRARGYRVVYTPAARLYHHESRSRWYQPPRPEEVQYMLDHWGALIARDPYYNPHLTLKREDFRFDLTRARLWLTEEIR